MKPASIIFLIVSVVVVIAGLVLCMTGVNRARDEGITLFSTDITAENGDVITTENLTDSVINKVKINVSDADVYICSSGSSESYLELVNFGVGTYDYSVQNKILLVDNSTSIFNIMHITDGNFKFDGLRQYLTYHQTKNSDKSLYLYLGSDMTTKTFEINVTNGNVVISELDFLADYTVVLEEGNILLRDISTKSAITVTLGTGNIFLDKIKCKYCDVTVSQGSIASYFLSIYGGKNTDGTPRALNLYTGKGDVWTSIAGTSTYGFSYTFSTTEGTVFCNGEAKENPYTFSDGASYVPLVLTSDEGDIFFNLAAEEIPISYDEVFPTIPDGISDMVSVREQ